MGWLSWEAEKVWRGVSIAVVFSRPAGCPARHVVKAKASSAFIAQGCVFLNHTVSGPWGQLESGRAFVLGSFWAVLGHLLEGLCESDWLPCCAWE